MSLSAAQADFPKEGLVYPEGRNPRGTTYCCVPWDRTQGGLPIIFSGAKKTNFQKEEWRESCRRSSESVVLTEQERSVVLTEQERSVVLTEQEREVQDQYIKQCLEDGIDLKDVEFQQALCRRCNQPKLFTQGEDKTTRYCGGCETCQTCGVNRSTYNDPCSECHCDLCLYSLFGEMCECHECRCGALIRKKYNWCLDCDEDEREMIRQERLYEEKLEEERLLYEQEREWSMAFSGCDCWGNYRCLECRADAACDDHDSDSF